MTGLTKSIESVARILHTLIGNFNSLGFNDIAVSFEQLKSALRSHHESKEAYVQCVANLNSLADFLIRAKEEIQSNRGISKSTEAEIRALINEFQPLQQPMVEEVAALDISGINSEQHVSVAAVDLPVEESGEEPGEEIDEELREIFIEESETILSRLNGLFTRWRNDGVSEEILAGIRREFHTIKGSAAAVGFVDISKLSHSVESLLEQGFDALSSDDFGLLNLLEETHDGIAAELGFIPSSGGNHIESLTYMVEHLLTDEGAVDVSTATNLEAESDADAIKPFEQSVGEQHVSVAAVDSPIEESVEEPGEEPVEEIDEELREIFIEESETILSRLNSLFTRWRNDGVSEEILAGIRREFHTIKGSAAAVGFVDISKLSHSVESLLEQGFDALSSDDFGLLNLLEETHDGIAAELGFIPSSGGNHIESLTYMVEHLLTDEGAVDVSTATNLEAESDADAMKPLTAGMIKEIDLIEDLNVMSEVLGKETSSLEFSDELGQADSVADIETLVSNQHATDFEVNLVQNSPSESPLEDSIEDDLARQTAVNDRQLEDAPQSSTLHTTDAKKKPITSGDSGVLRIENRKFSDILNYSGELNLTRTHLKTIADGTYMDLDSLRQSMQHIRDGLRDLEFEADAQMRSMPESKESEVGDEAFDPLQFDRYSRLQSKAREVNQQLDALTKIERNLSERASNFGGTLLQQLHLGEQLQDGLISARMVSVNEYLPRLRQLVRKTSRRVGKPMDFVASGGDIEVDRQVLDAMIPPFEHMIRNAIIHGMENQDDRKRLGKTPHGQIQINFVQQGSELLIDFADDGQGLNRDKLGQRAIEKGIVDDGENVASEQMLKIIAEPGFSTTESVSMESGRGIGMDVVLQAVRYLDGNINLLSEQNQGTTFQFRLPVTMTISQALLVRVGTFRFAVLSRSIDRVMRVRSEELLEVTGQRHVQVGDESLEVISLAERIGETSMSTAELFVSLVLVRLADRIAVFEVDQFEETLEIVTKTAGRQLTSITGVTGVTVLADTSIVLVLNLGEFVATDRRLSKVEIREAKRETVDEAPRVLADVNVATVLETVLTVDDSVVVRKVMQRDLEAIGLKVLSAVDGLDALSVLEQHSTDIALVDLEMPRMNGYELLTRLKGDERYQNIPVIMITSRAGETHRQRALDLGADGYLTKPYDIGELQILMETLVRERITLH